MRFLVAGAGLFSLLASCAGPPAALPAAILKEQGVASAEPVEGFPTQAAQPELKSEAPLTQAAVSRHETRGRLNLWHSWEGADLAILEKALARFQKRFPAVEVEAEYFPYDDLLARYQTAAAQGNGPTVLLGSSTWGPELYDAGLIRDVPRITTAAFLDRFENVPLRTIRHKGAWIGLPLSYRQGVVLMRNRALIPDAAYNLDDLLATAQTYTRGDVVGAVFDLGFYFSGAHMAGCKGQWMDAQGNPLFDNQTGYCWIDLLASIQEADIPVVFNSDQDLARFKEGRTALIIDGSWNIDAIAESIGAENLAIDPWPATEKGHLSGFFESENLFLNADLQPEDIAANTAFLRFMLNSSTQQLLVEGSSGSRLPVIKGIEFEERLQEELAEALSGGTPLPGRLQMDYYWAPLDQALKAVFLANVSKESALGSAANQIQISIKHLANGE